MDKREIDDLARHVSDRCIQAFKDAAPLVPDSRDKALMLAKALLQVTSIVQAKIILDLPEGADLDEFFRLYGISMKAHTMDGVKAYRKKMKARDK
jgi:hypothetical protein